MGRGGGTSSAREFFLLASLVVVVVEFEWMDAVSYWWWCEYWCGVVGIAVGGSGNS